MGTPYASLAANARCLVYFIRPVGMRGPVKIGSSVMPHRRKAGLESWSPFPLEVVATIDGPRAMERQFHALFKADHSHGEWFRWSPELEEIIAAIRAGIFPVELLPPPANVRPPIPRRKWSEEQKQTVRANNAARRAVLAERAASQRSL